MPIDRKLLVSAEGKLMLGTSGQLADKDCCCGCPGPHAPKSYTFDATGSTTGDGESICGSETSDSSSGSFDWVNGTIQELCRIAPDIFPSTVFHCFGSCDYALAPEPGNPTLASIFQFVLQWNTDIENTWSIYVTGRMRQVNEVPECGGSSNGTTVQVGPTDLGSNPIGNHVFNFDDGISFFAFTIVFS